MEAALLTQQMQSVSFNSAVDRFEELDPTKRRKKESTEDGPESIKPRVAVVFVSRVIFLETGNGIFPSDKIEVADFADFAHMCTAIFWQSCLHISMMTSHL